MAEFDWRDRAGALFECKKEPALGSRGMVVTNHPLASTAGMQMLAGGGNAFDAAIASLFALTVVEPQMVGIVGGGLCHIRFADGKHTVIDGQARAPLASSPDCFQPISDTLPDYLETVGRENAIGPKAVASPGNLKAWCEVLDRFGTVSLADAMAPAIGYASNGFSVTPYLNECISDAAEDLLRDASISAIFLPDGTPASAGSRLVMGDYAETLRAIASEGSDVFYGGSLGGTVADYCYKANGFLSVADLEDYATIERDVIQGTYRGYEIVGPPPPAASGIHIVQMMNILEGFRVGELGFGTPEMLHLLAEVLKIAFADRQAVTADPAFVDVPVDRLISKAYADERRSEIDLKRAKSWEARVALPESANTTHLTVADDEGNIVAMTQSINSLFGARIVVPGTGIIPNNYMHVFDPHPGHALSIAPGKRVTTSNAPMMAIKDGKPVLALGLPGRLTIYPSVMQTMISIIAHGSSVQEAVEAPRLWTQGGLVELETGFPDSVRDALTERGHEVQMMPHVGGGMNAIAFGDDGQMTGAACWRADGTPIALSGGLARPGVRFWPDKAGR